MVGVVVHQARPHERDRQHRQSREPGRDPTGQPPERVRPFRQGALRFHDQVMGAMHGQNGGAGEPHEHGVPIQNAGLGTRREGRPEGHKKIAVRIQRHAANEIP